MAPTLDSSLAMALVGVAYFSENLQLWQIVLFILWGLFDLGTRARSHFRFG